MGKWHRPYICVKRIKWTIKTICVRKKVVFDEREGDIIGLKNYITLGKTYWKKVSHERRILFWYKGKHFIVWLHGNPLCENSCMYIVFIPTKGKDLKNPANYRPISLFEVFYKLVSKILANKLAHKLPDIVDTFQFGFVKQHCISTEQSTIQLLHTFPQDQIKKLNTLFIKFLWRKNN